MGVSLKVDPDFLSDVGVSSPQHFLILVSFLIILNSKSVIFKPFHLWKPKTKPPLLRLHSCFPPAALSWMKINEEKCSCSLPLHWGNSITGTDPGPNSIIFTSYAQWFRRGSSLCSYLTRRARQVASAVSQDRPPSAGLVSHTVL